VPIVAVIEEIYREERLKAKWKQKGSYLIKLERSLLINRCQSQELSKTKKVPTWALSNC
jgi:hypothetical protein